MDTNNEPAFQHRTETTEGGSVISPSECHPALGFLAALHPGPDSNFNIELYTDVPKGGNKPNPDPLARRYANLTLSQVDALIPEWKLANAKGAGIFVAVNEFDGYRSKANLKRVRGVHADMDGVSAEQVAAIKVKLHPTIIVQSSTADRLQMYWLVAEGISLDIATAESINRRLVEFGADGAAVDVSRLLRLPGFRHMKYRSNGNTPTVMVLEVCHV